MHLVVLRLNGFQLPEELPIQLQPYAPLIDLSEGTASTENWAYFQNTNESPRQFTHSQPIADNHRIVAPVAVRLSPPPPPPPPPTVAIATKPPPPPPRFPTRTASIDVLGQPVLPARPSVSETPQRPANAAAASSTNTTPYLYSRTRPALSSTPHSDRTVLLEQIHDLLQPDHLQALSTLISSSSASNEQVENALTELKTRNAVLKGQLRHWEDRLTDLIDKRISLELQSKMQ